MDRNASKRTRDPARTKAQILKAAQAAFSARGYAQASVRDIARAADADPALLRRYFGSKLGLFEAALSQTLDVDALLAAPRDCVGAHIAALLTQDRPDEFGALPILMMAVSDPMVKTIALQQLDTRLMRPLAAWIGGPNGDLLAARLTMLCSGFFTYTQLLPLAAFSGGIDQATLTWFAQSLQAIIDDSP